MRLLILLSGIVLLGLIGGFGYVAMTDIPVEQQTMTVTIPNEQFFDVN